MVWQVSSATILERHPARKLIDETGEGLFSPMCFLGSNAPGKGSIFVVVLPPLKNLYVSCS
jgi:hypothetical protein